MVSIIIPVYNGSNFMREAIDSALGQTYQNIEVLVVNDGSCDDRKTAQIAQSYGNRIRYFEKENGGVSSALNLGIKEMKGDYFSWLSHDDVYMPEKIEKQVDALSKIDDKSTVVCCGYVHIDKDSNFIGSMPNVDLEDIKLLSWESMLLNLFESGPVNGCSLLIKRSIFEEVGLFDESLRFYQDGYMWYKIFMAKYSVLSIPNICVKGRIHGKQLTQTGQAVFRKDCKTISRVMIPQLMQVSTTENNFLLAYIKYNAKYGNISIVNNTCAQAKNTTLLKFKDYCIITLLCTYGIIRPIIRKIYYAVFRGINIA